MTGVPECNTNREGQGRVQLPRVLIIAGSDSSGGAGIQADLKTVSALGAFAMTAITALTAQNTTGVYGVIEIEPKFVVQQIEICTSDIGCDAVKTGMLANAGIIDAVAGAIRGLGPLVVDPVMIAKSGARLLAPDAIAARRRPGKSMKRSKESSTIAMRKLKRF